MNRAEILAWICLVGAYSMIIPFVLFSIIENGIYTLYFGIAFGIFIAILGIILLVGFTDMDLYLSELIYGNVED